MARKTQDFHEVSPDGEPAPTVYTERRNARAEKAEKRSLEELTQSLVSMSPGRLARLNLDEDIVEAVQDLARQGPKPSRARQQLRVQGLLRAHGRGGLQELLEEDSMAAGRDPALRRWQRRLLEGGDEALQDFMARHPEADRQQLRSLARRARGESPAHKRAARKLWALMQDAEAVEEE